MAVKLEGIPLIAENIKAAPFKIIKTFYKLIFDAEGDRSSRKKIRAFSGFSYDVNSEDFKKKVKFIDDNFSVSDLTSISNILHVDYDKTKEDLIKTICTSLMDLNSLRSAGDIEEDEDEENEEQVESEMLQALSLNTTMTGNRPPTFAMNFKDVEDSIRSFSGNGLYSIEKWVSDFEELSQLLGWGELHSFIFAKKSLSGIAKLFVQSECGINSWFKLKNALLKEFSSKLNSAQLHTMLLKRRMEKKETIQENFLVMKELATRGNIEEDALFQYVIDGIQDDSNSKIILYGATNAEEFKKKIKIYGEIKTQSGPVNQKTILLKEEAKANEVKTNKPHTRCFNCGIAGHRSADCRSKARGYKCFKCNRFGHRSFECTEQRRNQPALEGIPSNVNTIQEIGCELLNQAEVFINQEGLRIKRNEIKEDVLFIDSKVYEEDEVNVGTDVSKKVRSEIREIISSYRPEKIKKLNFKMKTIVKDEEPIASNPRRLPYIERRIVDEQVERWLKDEIVEPAVNEDEAMQKVKDVLKVAEEYGLEINKKKCQFMKRRVEFLGHVIEDGKIFPSTEKTKAVMKFPEPKTVKQVQSYLGLTGYFRKFIPSYSIIAKPLSDLLKKEVRFQFEDRERRAFDELKKILSHEPVLNIYKEGREMELHTDASQEGYGAILFQKNPDDNSIHPVYYMSKKTTDAERKYSSYELEVLAIVNALKKFRVYLLGNKFKIITDCSAFQKTMEKRDLATRVARWVMLLEEFDYTIEHRPGTRMQHVDSLSRHPIAMLEVYSVLTRIKEAQDTDAGIKAIKEILKDKPYEDYLLKNEILYKLNEENELLVIPKSMQMEIIQGIHGDGHLSYKKMEQIVKQDYYICNLKSKIEKHVANCVPCILTNRKRGKQEGYLHPLNKESIPLNTYHVDHLGPLESTNKNYKHILAVVDAFTKFVWLYPSKTTTTREVITKLDQQKQIFGNPARIISDRGTAFTSAEFLDYCKEEGIQHFTVTTGLPRANGQVERVNSAIIPVLSKMCIEDQTKWYKHVGRVQQVLNSSYHRSIGSTPIELMVGVKMRCSEGRKIKELIEEEMIANFDEERAELRRKAKMQIVKVQEENKKTYNLRRREPVKYKINDLVAVKRTQFGPGLKLKSKFLGPYRVTKSKQNDTYDVKKEGLHEGPNNTTTCAEYMKRWKTDDDDSSSEADELQERPSCGFGTRIGSGFEAGERTRARRGGDSKKATDEVGEKKDS